VLETGFSCDEVPNEGKQMSECSYLQHTDVIKITKAISKLSTKSSPRLILAPFLQDYSFRDIGFFSGSNVST